jgi:hypothetical protein
MAFLGWASGERAMTDASRVASIDRAAVATGGQAGRPRPAELCQRLRTRAHTSGLVLRLWDARQSSQIRAPWRNGCPGAAEYRSRPRCVHDRSFLDASAHSAEAFRARRKRGCQEIAAGLDVPVFRLAGDCLSKTRGSAASVNARLERTCLPHCLRLDPGSREAGQAGLHLDLGPQGPCEAREVQRQPASLRWVLRGILPILVCCVANKATVRKPRRPGRRRCRERAARAEPYLGYLPK